MRVQGANIFPQIIKSDDRGRRGMSASEIVEIEARRLLHSIRTQPDRPALDDSSLLALIERNVNSTDLDGDLERAKLEV